ncbi:transcriptional regulator [Candidatus Marsarchaeota archaeon]|nr:transcriptional regulator [Candidatus Marsarchaeota archaeon]
MADFNPIEQAIMKALEELGANNEKNIKTADDIMKKSNRPKGLVTNTLVELTKKGAIKRVAREKAAGYYIVK